MTYIHRIDPEKVCWMDLIWKTLYVLDNIPRQWSRPRQDYIDAGYCLDRYSAYESKVKK